MKIQHQGDAFQQAAAHCLHRSKDNTVVVGPLTWQPSDGAASKRWCFIVATAEDRRGFRCDQITVEADEREQMRRAFIAAMIRPGVVIHDTDDELYMVRLCETLWPGRRIAKIRQQIEAETAAREATDAVSPNP